MAPPSASTGAGGLEVGVDVGLRYVVGGDDVVAPALLVEAEALRTPQRHVRTLNRDTHQVVGQPRHLASHGSWLIWREVKTAYFKGLSKRTVLRA